MGMQLIGDPTPLARNPRATKPLISHRSRAITLVVALIVPSLLMPEVARAEPDRKSPWLAGALSLVVPGAGHYYLGKVGRARTFFGAEITVWGGYYLLRRQANLSKDDYKLYAAGHAGAVSDVDSDTYYEDVSWYDDSYDCNQDYRQPFRYTGEFSWQWDNVDNREHMKDMIQRSRDWRNRAKLSTSLAILTRVVSAIDAVTGGLRMKVGDTQVRVDPGRDHVTVEAKVHW